MLDTFVPSAPYPELGSLLADRYEGLAHAVTFPVPNDPDDDALVRDALGRLRGDS